MYSANEFPRLRLLEASLYRTTTRLRMPFRFGIAVMTEVPHIFLRGIWEVDGKTHTGLAADGLPPKWFDKSPRTSAEQDIQNMLLVIRRAVAAARALPASSAFDLWRQIYDVQMAWARESDLPPLLALFGVSLVERTMLDALARAHQVNFATLLRANLPGIRLGEVHPELAGRLPVEFLPPRPLAKVIVRHTVGLSDPLTAADVAPADRLNDGLPQTLEECVQFYGLRHFKLKLRGDVQADLARLGTVATVITRQCGNNYAFTLDGNEQYKQFTQFVELWERITSERALAGFFEKLMFIEQPLHRSVALDPAIARISAWRGGLPMIIDESDAQPGDLEQALDLGYAGTSHKNCKGVMKGVAHRCLINHRRATGKTAHRLVMSGEDLANIGPVALLQDLAVQAALGNESVERNGHHYYRGLSVFPPSISRAMLSAHGDLYTAFDGTARLDVRQGALKLDSVNAAPFGVASDLPMTGFEQLAL